MDAGISPVKASPSPSDSLIPDTGYLIPDTPKRKKANGAHAPPFVLPDWISAEDWTSYEAMRERMRKPMTDGARRLVVLELEKLRKGGEVVADVLQQSVRNSWLDVYPVKAKQGKPQAEAPAKKWFSNAI